MRICKCECHKKTNGGIPEVTHVVSCCGWGGYMYINEDESYDLPLLVKASRRQFKDPYIYREISIEEGKTVIHDYLLDRSKPNKKERPFLFLRDMTSIRVDFSKEELEAYELPEGIQKVLEGEGPYSFFLYDRPNNKSGLKSLIPEYHYYIIVRKLESMGYICEYKCTEICSLEVRKKDS